MLSTVETFIDLVRSADTEAKARSVLDAMRERLKARSAALVEYAPDLKSAKYLLDTDHVRQAACEAYFTKHGWSRNVDRVRYLLSQGRAVVVDGSGLDPADPFTAFAKTQDLADGLAIPISQQGDVAGVVFFSGGRLELVPEEALVIVCYALFSQLRFLHSEPHKPNTGPLTRREIEVMRLSADGLTSAEIAGALGISMRTVNQHVDNVVTKLGTRNRAHSIAELLRASLLT